MDVLLFRLDVVNVSGKVGIKYVHSFTVLKIVLRRVYCLMPTTFRRTCETKGKVGTFNQVNGTTRLMCLSTIILFDLLNTFLNVILLMFR